MSTILLVCAKQNSVALLAKVIGTLEINPHGHLMCERREFWDIVGNDVLMFHGHNGKLPAKEAAHFARPESSCIDDVLRNIHARGSLQFPLAVRPTTYGPYGAVTGNRCPSVSRALSQRIGHTTWINMPSV